MAPLPWRLARPSFPLQGISRHGLCRRATRERNATANEVVCPQSGRVPVHSQGGASGASMLEQPKPAVLERSRNQLLSAKPFLYATASMLLTRRLALPP
jgi:hypothetical protein